MPCKMVTAYQPIPRTWLEIDQHSLLHNLSVIKKLSKAAKIGVVVKGNGYGHGLTLIAQLLAHADEIHSFLVAGIEEALALRRDGCKKEIMVLSYHDGEIADALCHDIVLTATDTTILASIAETANKTGLIARIHLKVETGMHRLGIGEDNLSGAMKQIRATPYLRLEGIFTHLCDTNNPNRAFTEQQITRFRKIAQMIDPHHALTWHVAASGGLFLPDTFDFIRVGTMLYGSWKSKIQQQRITELNPMLELRPVMSWKTRIMQIKDVPAGHYIGYDITVRADRPLRIAIVPVGYVDGYQRSLSQDGMVMIRGCYAPIVGTISMNLMAVDVTTIPEAQLHDIVLLMGPYDKITPAAIAHQLGSNPNAITSVINPLIPRVVVNPSS